MEKTKSPYWEVPYIPMDPRDVGRTYDELVRINSQSGKGGVAHILRTDFGFQIPKAMQPELGKLIQDISDRTGREVLPATIKKVFEKEFVNRSTPIELKQFQTREKSGGAGRDVTTISASVAVNGKNRKLVGSGNGPIAAFSEALKKAGVGKYKFLSYEEHSLESGEKAHAVCYIQIADAQGRPFFGVGIDYNIVGASLKALVSALNRASTLAPAKSVRNPAKKR